MRYKKIEGLDWTPRGPRLKHPWHGMALCPPPPVPPPIVGTPLRPPVKVLRRCSGDCDQGLKHSAPAHAKAQDVHPDPPPSSVPPPPLVGCPSRALGSHTTGSTHALVRPDVSHTIGTCLALLRSTVSHTIGNSWAIVRADASTICLGTCLAHQPSTSSASVVGAWLTHHRHRQGHGAGGWLYEKSVPVSDTRCYVRLSRTPSAATAPWSARMP